MLWATRTEGSSWAASSWHTRSPHASSVTSWTGVASPPDPGRSRATAVWRSTDVLVVAIGVTFAGEDLSRLAGSGIDLPPRPRGPRRLGAADPRRDRDHRPGVRDHPLHAGRRRDADRRQPLRPARREAGGLSTADHRGAHAFARHRAAVRRALNLARRLIAPGRRRRATTRRPHGGGRPRSLGRSRDRRSQRLRDARPRDHRG